MLIYNMKLILLYIITVEDILITHIKHLQLKIMQERMYEIVEVRNLVWYLLLHIIYLIRLYFVSDGLVRRWYRRLKYIICFLSFHLELFK